MRNLDKEQWILWILTVLLTSFAILFTGFIAVNADVRDYPDSGSHVNYIWGSCTDEQRMDLPLHYQAYICGMTDYEFEYMARCIEAESDRSSNIEGKILIAATILNRVNSSSFPSTISGVLDQSGQFETTYNGWCRISSTRTSRWAIVEAQRLLQNGDIPSNVLYFNSIGYQYGYGYAHVGGNYFSCV